MKILFVDDEAHYVKEFEQELSAAGFIVIVLHSGKEAMEMSQKELPDLILLGEMLSDIGGNEVLQQLKTNPTTSHIPVVILSHFRNEDLVTQAMNLGAVEYI